VPKYLHTTREIPWKYPGNTEETLEKHWRTTKKYQEIYSK
jgi:hypothetical protein